MANEEHLKQLKQGVAHWNQWRVDQPDMQPDFSGADLSCQDLSGVDLSGANLIGAALNEIDLRRANLHRADLIGTDLFKADFFGADLSQADLRGAELIRANFIEANMQEANLSEADFSWADLIKVNLHRANLSRAALIKSNLVEANLSQANLTRVVLRGADLSEANLKGANLTEADLSGANLKRATLAQTNLFRANLNGANLGLANLRGANLSRATLLRADLVRADFSLANLSRTKLDRADLSEARMGLTTVGDVDLRQVHGLETVKHSSRSYLDIHTLYRSRNKIPEIFLKGMGIPDAFIIYMGSLSDQISPYHPCFISYSSLDEPFAERLYADLQAAGVYCWFAPEDLKMEAKSKLCIEELLRFQDKLLLVLSENSVKSSWVEPEIENILAWERHHNESVLFPIRLDETVMNIETGWPALIRGMRSISDFENWQEQTAYNKALTQLLHDLKIIGEAGKTP